MLDSCRNVVQDLADEYLACETNEYPEYEASKARSEIAI